MKAYKAFLQSTFPRKQGSVGQDLDAYLAGIFDGEGWISVSFDARRKWGPYITMGVGNSFHPVLALLERAYGGHISPKSVPVGNKPMWTWKANGKDSYWALARMLPWLRIKQEKARLALIILQNKPLKASGGQVSPYQKMAITKALGRFGHVIRRPK